MIIVNKLIRFQAMLEYLYTIGSIGKMVYRKRDRRLAIQAVDPFLTFCVEVDYRAFRFVDPTNSDESKNTSDQLILYLNIPALLNILSDIPAADMRSSFLTFCDIGVSEHGNVFTLMVDCAPAESNEGKSIIMPRDQAVVHEPSVPIQNPKDRSTHSESFQNPEDRSTRNASFQEPEDRSTHNASFQNPSEPIQKPSVPVSSVRHQSRRFLMRSVALHPYVENLDRHYAPQPQSHNQPHWFHIECFAVADIQTFLLRMSLVGSYTRWMYYKDRHDRHYNQMFTYSDVGMLTYRWLTHPVSSSVSVSQQNDTTSRPFHARAAVSVDSADSVTVKRIKSKAMTKISYTKLSKEMKESNTECLTTEPIPLRALRMIHNWPTTCSPNKLEWRLQTGGSLCIVMEYDDYTMYGFACQADAVQSQYDPITHASCAVESHHQTLTKSNESLSVRNQLNHIHDKVVRVCCK
jgi:hypothetical protein